MAAPEAAPVDSGKKNDVPEMKMEGQDSGNKMDKVAQVKNADTNAEKVGGEHHPGVEKMNPDDQHQTVKGNKIKKADNALDDQSEQKQQLEEEKK